MATSHTETVRFHECTVGLGPPMVPVVTQARRYRLCHAADGILRREPWKFKHFPGLRQDCGTSLALTSGSPAGSPTCQKSVSPPSPYVGRQTYLFVL